MRLRRFAQASVLALAVAACATEGGRLAERAPPVNHVSAEASLVTDATRAHPELWPTASSPAALSDARTEKFVTDLMAKMTLEEKVGQTIQADISAIKPEDLREYPLGSILAGGNSSPGGDERAPAEKWIELARAFRAEAAARAGTKIPLIFGIDAVHGHSNVVGATIFPHNIGLGAMRDPALMRKIGEVTAIEMAATGVDWTFAPTLAVPRDDRWGRSYEGYAEHPEVAQSYAGPLTLGLQGPLSANRPLGTGKIAGSAKHFLADGGTFEGKDQGDAKISERELIDIHLSGYPQAIDAGILTVMASFSGWNGLKHTGNETILTDVLRGPLGFDGFLVSDWNAHGQIPGCTNESCALAFNAGIDMFMAPDSWKPLYKNTLAQVRSGEIPMARLDEAVRRILRVKAKAGLFESKRPLEGQLALLGAPEHRAVAREAVRKSLVLLKNENGALPIRANANVLVAGAAADDIGQASGGWTITWQGTGNTRKDFPNGQSIWEGLREAIQAGGGRAAFSPDGSFSTKPDVAIVVFGETPYAEFQGDVPNLDFVPREPLETLKRLKAAGIPTVSVFLSGRPMWTNPEINQSDAFVAAWLPGAEGGGVADVLVADAAGKPRFDFQGKLSFSWPKDAKGAPLNVGAPGYDPQFAYGYGLSYGAPAAVGVLPEASGVDESVSSVDQYFVAGKFVPPWGLSLRDEGGEFFFGPDVNEGASPRAAVSSRRADGAGQESARTLAFSGKGWGLAFITGKPVDLTRQANAELAVGFRYRVDAAPKGEVRLQLGEGSVNLTPTFKAAPVGEWRSVKVRLSCLRDAGTDIANVAQPFGLRTAGAFTVTVEDVRLASNEGDAICPAR